MSPKHADSSKSGAARHGDKNVLPSKEQNLFKSVVRHYETKQLKKALKAADSILKKFPDHGETLAMKGLTLNALDKRAEATELVRRGLRMDMKSHVCWHVYGLLYRSKRDYREAVKAYLNALRIDKDNQQILRDLALLQVQIRDYEGLEDTRRRLLTVRPNQQNNWIGFALSYHLLGNFPTAISVLNKYLETISDEEQDRYEVSELLLYKNMILEESGRFADALKHLDEISARVVDRLAVLEARARLHAAQGSFKNAKTHFEQLVNLNPDNYSYQHALHLCDLQNDIPVSNSDESNASKTPAMSFKSTSEWCIASLEKIRSFDSEKDIVCILSTCDEITTTHPYSLTALRIALDIIPSAKHPQFIPRTDFYVRRFLRKGIPSLYSDLKSLYDNSGKAQELGTLFESYLECLESSKAKHLPPLQQLPLDSDDADTVVDESETPASDNIDSSKLEPPCTLLWVLHFLAQHYDRLGCHRKALETIERAIRHTPTAIECYLVKARILRHSGDFAGAVEAAGEARTLDLADRYLNTKCCKHALRAERVSDAESWVSLFTRDGDSGGAQALYDMQCIWFEMGAAESYMRSSQWALSLKKLTSIERIYADMVEDQFDFHSYCLRKVTLRAYITLLRFEDRIRRHPFFARAARGLVECLLRIFELTEDERRAITGHLSDIKGYAQMTDAQRKKAVSKRKKQLMRQRQVQASGGHGKGGSKQANDDNANDTSGGSGGGKGSGGSNSNESKSKGSVSVETDPNGVEQLKELLKDGLGVSGTILKDAGRLTRELQIHLPNDVDTHVLAYEVTSRRQQYLLALRAVRNAQRLDRENGGTLSIAVRLAHEVGKLTTESKLATDENQKTTQTQAANKAWPPIVEKVFQEKGDVLGGLSIPDFVKDFVDRNSGHSRRLLLACRVRLWMMRNEIGEVGSKGENGTVMEDIVCKEMCQVIESSQCEGIADNSLAAPFCRDLILTLKADRVASSVVKRLGECCKDKFPQASCF